jgi:hypothetical protein
VATGHTFQRTNAVAAKLERAKVGKAVQAFDGRNLVACDKELLQLRAG